MSLIAVAVLGIIAACSRSNQTTSVSAAPPPEQRTLTEIELFKLYDPSSLVEIKTLHGLPKGIQDLLGVDKNNYDRIADVGEDCNPTDVVGGGTPTRCFFVGGASPTSAVVAYKIGGYAGQSGVAIGYVHTEAKWIEVRRWDVGFPNNLKALLEMTSVAPDDRPRQPFDSCFHQINGKCSY